MFITLVNFAYQSVFHFFYVNFESGKSNILKKPE